MGVLKMKDLISIIIPVYNSSKYIKTCIESILDQSYQNIEIIAVNDGSTDNSLDILKEYDNIIVIDKKNTGVSDTRNVGVLKANGKFIMFVDSDDYLPRDAVEKLYNCIIVNDTDVVRGISKIFLSNDNYYFEKIPRNLKNHKLYKNNFKDLISSFFDIKNNINCYSPLLLIKREKVPKFDSTLSFMEDTLFYIQLLNNIDTIWLTDIYSYDYRYNFNSASKNTINISKNINSMLCSFSKITELLIEYGFYSNEVKELIDKKKAYILISKLDILIYYDKKYFFNYIRQNKEILNRDIILVVNIKKLKMVKKVEIFLLNIGMYRCFFILEKLKKLV